MIQTSPLQGRRSRRRRDRRVLLTTVVSKHPDIPRLPALLRGSTPLQRGLCFALIADFPRREHALEGLAQEVELALTADDVSGAQVALATMEADFPDDPLTEAARAYFVLVAGEDALPARTAASAMVATAGQSSASIGTEVSGFTLHAAYPNPFNPQAVVPFSVTEAARVRIVVFDMLGREVATLADGRYDAGVYDVVFDGSDLPSGMYLMRANVTPENGNAASAFTQRITLLK